MRIFDKISKKLANIFHQMIQHFLNLKFKDYKSLLTILNSLFLIWLFLGVSTFSGSSSASFSGSAPASSSGSAPLTSFLKVGSSFNYYIFQLIQILALSAGIYSILKSYAPGILIFSIFCLINTILLIMESLLFSLISKDPTKLDFDCGNLKNRSLSISPDLMAIGEDGSVKNHNATIMDYDTCIMNGVFIIKLQLSVGLMLSLSNTFLIVSYLLKGMSNGSFQDDELDPNATTDSYYIARSLNPWDTIREPLPTYQPKEESDPPMYQMTTFGLECIAVDSRLFPCNEVVDIDTITSMPYDYDTVVSHNDHDINDSAGTIV